MAEFTATARIPCRPLSYGSSALAEPEELLIDYELGNVWVCKSDGTFVDIGNSIKEIIKEDPTIVENITIEIEGNTYTLETIIADNTTNIEQILNALGYYKDPETGDIKFDLLDKIATIDPDTGEVTFTITSNDVVETEEKQFVSAEEKEEWSKATHPEVIRCTILGGASAWTVGNGHPYEQKVIVEGILETDTPIVDISLGDIYETIQKQLDSYAYIYKILTYDGYIMVYASEPTEDDIVIQMRIDR